MTGTLASGFESQAEAQRHSVDATRAAIDGSLDAIASAVPGSAAGVEQVRAAMDEQFAAVEDVRADVAESTEENTREYEDFADASLDALDDQLAVHPETTGTSSAGRSTSWTEPMPISRNCASRPRTSRSRPGSLRSTRRDPSA